MPQMPHLFKKGDLRYPVGLVVAHRRVWKLWGPASRYRCIDCLGPAKDWAYDGTDPTERLVMESRDRGQRYSQYPEFYAPKCKKCHLSRDRRAAAEELFEYRKWKNDTGLTLREMYPGWALEFENLEPAIWKSSTTSSKSIPGR